jgi:hypothetical protein
VSRCQGMMTWTLKYIADLKDKDADQSISIVDGN